MKNDILPAPLSSGAQFSVACRIELGAGAGEHGKVVLNASVVAKLMVVTMADYMDQAVEVNGWRDHHQVDAPMMLSVTLMKHPPRFWLTREH